jgi:hypothetical protein
MDARPHKSKQPIAIGWRHASILLILNSRWTFRTFNIRTSSTNASLQNVIANAGTTNYQFKN